MSLLYIALGPGVDAMNEVHQGFINDPDIPMSYERADTWTVLMMAHDNALLIVFLGFIVLLVMVSLATHTGPTY